jgi:nucleoside-diphosphate-sugar epimerase
VLRLLDLESVEPGGGEEAIVGSVTDMAAMNRACKDVDAVIHLAWSEQLAWDGLVSLDVRGADIVFEAARRNSVRRVLFASSSHAVGAYPREDAPAPDYLPAMPDSYYGVAKATVEALGAFYHHRFGLDVVVVRIGWCCERPTDLQALSIWLSPDDAGRLFEACLSIPHPGFCVVWGVSDNRRGWFSLDAARSLGYQPQDDAERYAPELLKHHGEPDLSQAVHARVGGTAAYLQPSEHRDRLAQCRGLVRRIGTRLHR